MYFNVNVNVLKQNCCALVGVIKDWKNEIVLFINYNTLCCYLSIFVSVRGNTAL